MDLNICKFLSIRDRRSVGDSSGVECHRYVGNKADKGQPWMDPGS
jgi:hypothetical protein